MSQKVSSQIYSRHIQTDIVKFLTTLLWIQSVLSSTFFHLFWKNTRDYITSPVNIGFSDIKNSFMSAPEAKLLYNAFSVYGFKTVLCKDCWIHWATEQQFLVHLGLFPRYLTREPKNLAQDKLLSLRSLYQQLGHFLAHYWRHNKPHQKHCSSGIPTNKMMS